MTIGLRLFTLFCYFLPCTFFLATCNGLSIDKAYNKKEAEKNILIAAQAAKPIKDDTLFSKTPSTELLDSNVKTKNVYNDQSSKVYTSKNMIDKFLFAVLLPTDKSASGIGSIWFHKNLIGKITISISIFLSVILLISIRIQKIRRNHKYLLLLNLFCVLTFIIDSLLSEVSLLFGIWALMTILIIQITVEYRVERKAYR